MKEENINVKMEATEEQYEDIVSNAVCTVTISVMEDNTVGFGVKGTLTKETLNAIIEGFSVGMDGIFEHIQKEMIEENEQKD